MKKIKYILLGLSSMFLLGACNDKDDIIGNPIMDFKNDINSACFGDSLPFTIKASDVDVPLSTLKAQLYFGEEMVSSTTIRTKNSGADYSAKIFIPFMANIPEGKATLKFILQNINFTTSEKEMEIPVKRPDYPNIQFVTEDGTVYNMTRDDLYSYSCKGKFAQKQKGYLKLPKYGDNGNELNLGWENDSIKVGAEALIPFSNSKAGNYIISFNSFSFDASPFVVLKINDEELGTLDDNNSYVDMSLVQGQSLTLSGFPNLGDWWIDPDYFTQDEDGTLKFLPISGTYRIIANTQYQYLNVQAMDGKNTASLQLDGSGAIWIIGDGIGKPSLAANTVGWVTEKALCMSQITPKKYQITLVAGQNIKADDINFKFFHQAGWGGEFGSSSLSTNSDIIFVGNGDNGRDSGNLGIVEGKSLDANGIYRLTIDVSSGINKAVLTVEKIGTQSFVEKKVFLNNNKMTTTDNSIYSQLLSITQNEELSIKGIYDLDEWWADPDYFVLDADNDQIKFLPVSADYKIIFNRDQKTITAIRYTDNAESTMSADGHGGLWMMGWGVGSPSLDQQIGWNPGSAYCVPEVKPGIYQFTGVAGPEKESGIGMRLRYDYLSFKFFFQDGWGSEFTGDNKLTLLNDSSKLIKDTGNFELADGVNLELGEIYVVTIDLTKGVSKGTITIAKK